MTTKRPAGKVYKKLAVKAGVYRQTSVDPYTGQMVTETVYVSPQYLRQSAWNTMQMMQRGLDVPVCLDHQESAVPKRRNVEGWLADEMRNSVGLLKSVKYDPASESHEYIFEVSDPKIAEKIDLGVIKRVSPNFHNEFSPGDGTRWPNVVAHLALTFRPKDGKQSPDSMEAAAVTAPGQTRFSVLTPARNSKIVIVPMHRLEFSVLRSMVRKQKNGEWHFRSTDYLFRFNSHAEFEQWLKKKYTKTLRMSIAGKTNYVLYFAVVHAPVGGVHINGRLYKGGQFIPAVNLEGLDQQTRQKIQESTDQRTAARSAKAAQYRNEGEDWHQAVARHAGEHAARPISEDDERAASRRLKSLQAHHGDQVMERIASLAGQESAQLAKLSPDDPKAEHLKRRLRAYARMSEHMQGAGNTPVQDDSGHRNALAEMADASSDVDTAVRSRLHNEMKTELADRMKDDWQHLTDEQKAEFEQKINALPHTALGDPDEHGEYSDKETSPEAQQLIDEVNDTAYEARRSNEAKAYEQKRIDQHKKDIEEADKRGMVFERPDNHNNPGDLKVNPDKVHLAKQAMEEYRAKAKQHLEDSKNQLNKKEAARSKRMHRAMSDAADMIQDQVGEIEKHAPAMNKIAEAVSGASRLASSGNFDKSTSADKPGLAVDDKAKAKEIANRNVKNVALKIVSEKQDLKKSTPETVKKMFEDIAANANAGLIDPSKLYRTHEDQKGLGYAKVAEIKGKMDGFYRDLAQRLSSGADPVATAAWAEQQIQRIHPLSDGVGRTSKLMSNWILHNAGINPPKYPESGSYFKNMHDEAGFAKDFAGWVNGTPPAGDASAQAALAAPVAAQPKAWKPGQTIRSDDPNAVEALQAKHDSLKRENEIAKKANAIIRKYAQYDRFGTKEVKFDKGKTRDEVVADLVALGLSDRVANSVLTPPSWGELGFPAYHFANNNGQMAQIRKRMESVGKEQTRQAAQGDVETEYSGGVTVKEDTGDGRIKISFPGKPSKEVIESLKRGGFRWSPTNGTWQRHLNNGGRYAVDDVLSKHGFTKQEAAPETSPAAALQAPETQASSQAQPVANEAVGDSGAIVKNAYDNAVHSPKEQHEANLAKVKESLSGMSKAQLSDVVKQMELYGSENKSKAGIINDVVDKINNRRGTYQRAQMVMPLPKQDAENRASNDALSGKSAKSDNPVKKVLGFDADSIDEIHSKLVENNPTDAYSQNHTKAAASVMINNHIGSFLRDVDNKIKSNEPITPDEEAAYDAIQQDKHFGDLREKLSDLGGAGWQAANSDIIPAKIEPNHIAGHEETYKNVIKDSRIESDSLAHDSHKMNYEDHKRKLDDIQKQLDENGKARSRLSDLEYKAQRNGNKALANKYAKQVEELDTKSSRLVDQRGEVIDAANYSQSQMARTDPALPEFVKFAHFATKGRYTGEPNEKMRKAIAPRAVQFAKQVGYDAEVGEEIAKELSKGLRVADKEGFDRIVRRSAGLVENQKKAERQRASVKAMEGYGDLSEMDKNTIENNISAGSIDSEIERIAKDKIEKNKAVAEGNRKYEQEQKQAGERKAQIEKMVADIAAGKTPENIKSSDMRAAVENAMKRKGDFRPSKGDTHRKFPKSHYTKDNMANRYNFQKLVKERGYWTDGKAIVAVPDDVRAASKGGEGAVPSIDPILQAADKAKSKARIVGEATPDDTNSFHKYLVEDQYGNQMQVAKDTHASVMSLHPDAEMYIPETSDGVGNLIYYKKDGKTVGVAVPLTRGDKEPKATVQDVKHIKEFAEPGPYKPEQMKVIGNMVAHPDMKAMVRIRSEGNKSAKHYKIDGYHGTYATENKAKEAAKELLSYIHGTEEGDETGDHIFKPKGQKTQADEGTRKKLDFHQSLNDHIASRQYKKSKVMQKGDVPEGKYSTKPGEYEVTEHDDESSPFKIVSSPYSRSGGRLKKEPTHSVVHKKSGAMLGSWTDIASAKKHAALAEGLHSWDFDKPDHFVDKKEEGDALKAKLRKAEDVIEKDEYDPEIGIPARDKNKLSPGAAVTFSRDGSDLSGKILGSELGGYGLRYKVKTKNGAVYVKPDDIKFAIVHAPVGGADIDGKHYLGGQFTPGQGGSSGGVVAKADSHIQQEKKQFHVKADAHARNLKLKPQGVNVQGIGKVNGLVHGDLAVHPVAGNWVVSHIPTGKRVALDGSKNAAVKKAYLLHHGLDWSNPGPKHLARLRDVTRGEIPRDLPEHKLSPHGDLPGKHVPITKEAATAFMKHEPNYLDAREKYIRKNGTFDKDGKLKSIPLNVDEWREFVPGYVGTNAHVVHEASYVANDRMLDEMLKEMKGKGNDRVVILGGGGGSGKGTSVAKHFDESDYPIRIDQTSSNYNLLMDRMNAIKKAGFTPEIVFVDRPPEDAWKGVVGRAMRSLKNGEHPRTVPHSVAIQANLDARNVALRLAQENPDIRLRVIDNHDVDNSRILDDPSDIIRHLTKQSYNKDDIIKGAKEHVDELEKHGSIPSHVAKGLRGEA